MTRQTILVPSLCLLLAAAVTLGYCIAVWYVAGLWSGLVPEPDLVGGLAAWTISPLPLSVEYSMLHWQGAALVSLLLNTWWARYRLRLDRDNGCTLPFVCHLAWLTSASFLHVAGALSPFVIVAYTIS